MPSKLPGRSGHGVQVESIDGDNMRTTIYEDNGIEIFEESTRFFIRYDAGALVVVIRLDEISKAEAELAMQGPQEAYRVLLSLQERLRSEGIDPHKTNI